MTNDGKLYIIITDKWPGDGQTPSPDSSPNPQKTSKDEKEKSNDFIFHQFYNFVENQAKQFINYSINNIGNFTGNYVVQRNVNNAVSAINIFKNIGLSVYTGFKTAGPYGALAGAVLSIASQTINFGYQEWSNQVAFRKQNYSLDVIRERSGLYSIDNDSRTGGW